MKQPDGDQERHGEPQRRDDFAALFAMLDEPVSEASACAGFERLLTRAASPTFRRETLGKAF